MKAEILPLTGLRAVAAWWVVAFHFLRQLVAPGALSRTLASGHVAVDVFFVLSGYVLAKRYAVADFSEAATRHTFWGRRFARVYPLYLVSLVVGFIAASPRAWRELLAGQDLPRYLVQLATLNAWWHKAMFPLNWAAWSLSAEAFFYLLFPYLFGRVRRLSRPALIALLASCCLATFVGPAAYGALDPDHLGHALQLDDEVLWSWYLKFNPVLRLPAFVAGIAAAVLPWRRRRWLALSGALSLGAVVVAGAVPYAFAQAGVLLPCFVAVIAGLDRAEPSWLSTRPLVVLGRASYATYILHVPLFLFLASMDPALWENRAHVAAYFVVLLAVSLVAHATVEEPARRSLERAFASLQERAP